jgi:pimeloyl-ACP methyl ester carboxylesterase
VTAAPGASPPPPEGHDGGVQIYAEVTGEGPVVVLTHGFAASSHMFATTVPALAKDHTVIVWDMPGHGHSAASDDASEYTTGAFIDEMLHLLDTSEEERAVWLGHSLGGYLSLELALAHPDRTRGLVLVDTGPGYRNDQAREGWNRMANRYAEDLETKGLAGVPGGEELSASVHSSATGLAIGARQVLTQTDSHVIDGLPSIEAPTLVVVGDQDEPFLKGSHYMADKIPNATIAVIQGAGHAPPVSHSDEFNTVLRTFLERLDP